MAPRTQTAGNPSLRNRNRVTNKTRLKVIKGNIDADPIVLDEDEERARVVSTAGVDAEDANEHHLQAVLSAASHRATTLAQKAYALSNAEKDSKPGEQSKPAASSTAFIPVPDAAGVVEHADELYPPGRWVEYSSYIKFSDSVDESLFLGLNDGFTYVMDERDAEWLDKNNQEARGEGTSSQASSSAAGTTTRSGGTRSMKAKGKEAETVSPVQMDENEFELVMGLFEKLTHDNTPFLHVTFQQQQGSCIPPFSDYHDVFANELARSHFARFMHPPQLPAPATLVRMAKAVYPHWRERKIEREGQRIIPSLNFDESDSKNESYICFRRRDTKAIRKTRAAQVSSSEKMLRLKGELGHATELSRNVLGREMHKKEAQSEGKDVWEKRVTFLDLKRKYPSLIGKDDEEILIEKERPPKKLRNEPAPTIRIKSRANGDASASPAPAEPQMRPRDRHAAIQAAMESIAKRMKEADHGWDDQIDSSYQQPPISLPDRHFRHISDDGTLSPTPNVADGRSRGPLFLRLRRGRGGRILVDRRRPHLLNGEDDLPRLRNGKLRPTLDVLRKEAQRSSAIKTSDLPEKMESWLQEDRIRRLAERWRFDNACESTGGEEENRVLLDDYDPKHMRVQAMLLNDNEPLMTDSRLLLYDSQTGTHNYVSPVKPVLSVSQNRRDTISYQQPRTAPPVAMQPLPTQHPAPPQPVPVSQPVSSIPNPLQSPVKIASMSQHARAPSNGPQRSPSRTSTNGGQSNVMPTSSSPSNQTNATHINGHSSQTNSVNGIPAVSNAPTNGVGNGGANGVLNNANGVLTGLSANLSSLTPAQQQALVMHQKQQNMQKFYANYAANMQRSGQAPYSQALLNNAGSDLNVTNGGTNGNMMAAINMNLKLPAQRQMQWATANQRSQPSQNGILINGSDTAAAMQSLQNMQNMQSMQQLAGLGLLQSHNLPAVNGHGHNHLSPPRSAHSPPNGLAHTLSLSPHMGSPAQTQSLMSPSRNMHTPVPPSPSPLLQHQVPNLVGTLPAQNQGF